jgi:hypothetical protein
MAPFSRLIRFESGGKIYFSDLGKDTTEPPSVGTVIQAYQLLEDLNADKNSSFVALDKVGSGFPSSQECLTTDSPCATAPGTRTC